MTTLYVGSAAMRARQVISPGRYHRPSQVDLARI